MDYKQYLRSAERHLLVCKQMLKDFDSFGKGCQKSYVLSEAYYLSGYILESSLSYAFFSHISFRGDIYLSAHYNNKQFKTHNILQKYAYMTKNACIINDLMFISKPHSKSQLQRMFSDWDVKYRYEQYRNLSKDSVNAFIAEIEKNLLKIKKLYPEI